MDMNRRFQKRSGSRSCIGMTVSIPRLNTIFLSPEVIHEATVLAVLFFDLESIEEVLKDRMISSSQSSDTAAGHRLSFIKCYAHVGIVIRNANVLINVSIRLFPHITELTASITSSPLSLSSSTVLPNLESTLGNDHETYLVVVSTTKPPSEPRNAYKGPPKFAAI